MIQIKYSRLKNPNDTGLISRYIHLLPEDLQVKVNRYRRVADAQRSLLGKLLLLEVLKPYGYDSSVFLQLKYSAFDRPYLDGLIDFNITHAEDYVVVAASQVCKVGIDIEPIKPIDVREFTAFFSEAELASIQEAPDSFHHFFTLWTQKEALIKADGMGMSLPVKEISVAGNMAQINGQQWFLTKIDIAEGYLSYLATDRVLGPGEIQMKEVDF